MHIKAEHMKSESQLHPTLCDPMNCSPPGSSVHDTLQARILEWIGISFSRDLPDPGIEPTSPALADFFFFFTAETPGKPIRENKPTEIWI